MYVVTFYSFKGGVGRTQALVNVGVELARTGRRVLLVDFDLEAPGIDTFNLPRPTTPPPGIVEYVTRYLDTNEAPDVSEFLYPSPGVGANGGELWIMPAGREDDSYGYRLSLIDWHDLYENREGYFLFEDLKEQWKAHLDPDYVLIDSRTGYTDTAGICTRQLPDAVAVLFFPTEQNLKGLRRLVADIRGEASGPRRKEIQLYFVTSNVPDLDDEDQILAGRMRRFRDDLGYRSLSATIHHYPSLALLNQTIFTAERPQSRLAQEYRGLTKLITRENPEDRESALELLHQITRRDVGRRYARAASEERLAAIRDAHRQDSEIVYYLAVFREQQGRVEEAASLLNEAISLGYRLADALLARARLLKATEPDVALRDLEEVFKSADVTEPEIHLGVRLLQELRPEWLAMVPGSPGVQSLEPHARYHLALALQSSRPALEASVSILKSIAQDETEDEERRRKVRGDLAGALIGLGRFREAMSSIADVRPDPATLAVNDAFNYGVAEWAEARSASLDMFERVVQLDQAEPHPEWGSNYAQCLAIAHWVLGNTEEARAKVRRARQQAIARGTPTFSAWRYMTVSVPEFLVDLDAMAEGLARKGVVPAFMQKGSQPLVHEEG